MEAKFVYSPSYAYRSLLSAKYVMETCYRWKIGNGKKVRIWHDNWLPGGSNTNVVSHNGQFDRSSYVKDLIGEDLKQWRLDLIFSSFNAYEANKIVSITLSFRLLKDRRVWILEKNGLYSMKSAYHHIGVEK